MLLVLHPVSATAGGSWTNPGNAIGGDSDAYATNTTGNGWIELAFAAPVEGIPRSIGVAGLRIGINCGLKADPELPDYELAGDEDTATLEMQFSVNGGASFVGDTKGTPEMRESQLMAWRTVGASDDLWGRTWLPEEINQGGLRLRVRRPLDVNEMAVPRLLESLYLEVFADAEEIEEVADRVYSLQRCVIGPESTEGTRASSFYRALGSRFTLQEVIDSEEVRAQGDLVPIEYVENLKWAQGNYESNEKACYNDITFWLDSVIGVPVKQTLASGVIQRTYDLPIRSRGDRVSNTLQWGDPAGNGCEEVLAALAQTFNLEFGEKKICRFSGALIAKPIDPDATLEAGANCVQTMTRAGSPGSGATVFEFKGAQFTIQWDDDASEQQAAIQACPTVGSGNFLVTGSGPFVYTAAGDLAGQEIPKINVVSSTLNQGSQTFAMTTVGGLSHLDYMPIVANHVMYQADAYANIASGEIAKVTRGGLALTGRYEPQVYQDDDSPATYSDVYEPDNTNVEVPFTLAAGATEKALRAAAAARTAKFIRIKSTGPVIASSIPYSMTIDMACKIKTAGEYKKDGQVVARDFVAGIRFDEGQGFALKIVVVGTRP